MAVMTSPEVPLRARALARRVDVVHGFCTRTDTHGASLDLRTGADARVWERVSIEVAGSVRPMAHASQVHGRSVRYASGPGSVGEADAIWTDVPDLLLVIRTADCVPIVIAGVGAVAVIHAGWRGLAAGVIAATIDAMGQCGPLHAAVGPAICLNCYEVGEEVVAGLATWTPEHEFVDRTGKRPHVDPGAAAVAQLREGGVQTIERVTVCSRCDPRLWSHRQEGAHAGRQGSVIGLRC